MTVLRIFDGNISTDSFAEYGERYCLFFRRLHIPNEYGATVSYGWEKEGDSVLWFDITVPYFRFPVTNLRKETSVLLASIEAMFRYRTTVPRAESSPPALEESESEFSDDLGLPPVRSFELEVRFQ